MQNGRSSLTSLAPDSAQGPFPVTLTAALTTLTSSTIKPLYSIDSTANDVGIVLPDPTTCPGYRTKFIYSVAGNDAIIGFPAGQAAGACAVAAASVPVVLTSISISFANTATAVGSYVEIVSNGLIWNVIGAASTAADIVVA